MLPSTVESDNARGWDIEAVRVSPHAWRRAVCPMASSQHEPRTEAHVWRGNAGHRLGRSLEGQESPDQVVEAHNGPRQGE